MTPELKSKLESEIAAHPVVLFMKGNLLMGPQCGFSAATLDVLQKYGPVHAINVLSDPEVRAGIKELTNWPTIPQVFIHGKFVGGCDIVREMDERGELQPMIEKR
jgi:monothiol glutaredoxin